MHMRAKQYQILCTQVEKNGNNTLCGNLSICLQTYIGYFQHYVQQKDIKSSFLKIRPIIEQDSE